MLTICSNCATRFRVSQAQLDAAAGQVRCGRCQTVFDAKAALQEEADAPTPKEIAEAPMRADSGDAPELDVAMAASAEPAAETPGLVIPPRAAALPAIDDLFAGFGALPEAPLPEDALPTPGSASKLKPLPEPPQVLQFEPAAILPSPVPPPRGVWPGLAWSLGGLGMLLWLAAQLVDADREALSQNLVLGPSLQALYAALGRPLTAPRSVSSWNVSTLNVTSDPQAPGALSITGALENQADFVQPWPLLRVVLTDRYGEALRSRDFKPAEYLPASQSNVLPAAGQGARFRIDVLDPGADAVGFSLSPCLDLPRGRVCAATEHD